MTEVDLDDVESAMLRHDDPVVTAGDLADDLPCSSRHVLDLLRLLERAGDVESKQTGARAVAWYHVDRVRPPIYPVDEHPDQAALDEAAGPTRAEEISHEVEQRDEAVTAPARARGEEVVDVDQEASAGDQEDVDEREQLRDALSGRGDTLERRVDAVLRAREWLRENGPATKREVVSQLFDPETATYAVEDSWWERLVMAGWKALDDIEAPQAASPHAKWRVRD